MADPQSLKKSSGIWTLKKAVTTLAIAPQTESLTRTGRMAYNLMIFKAQRMNSDAEGGYTAPISEIVKGFGATTRDSARVREYIEKMCTTLVRWYPLSSGDEAQSTIIGLEQAPSDPEDPMRDSRVFTLLSEARFSRRGGEQWVTWFFPPSIREMVIEPMRWAQIDIQELAALSRYASVALFEVCSRYKDVPGGLTNRGTPDWWITALRADAKESKREWRKFKNETLKPALAEISQRTSLEVRLVEYKKGKSVTEVQFAVRRKRSEEEGDPGPVSLTVVDKALNHGIKERDLDALVDQYGEDMVVRALNAIDARNKVQMKESIEHPLAYLRKVLRNAGTGGLFDAPIAPSRALHPVSATTTRDEDAWLQERRRQINAELEAMSAEQVEEFADLARAKLSEVGGLTAAMQKRFAAKQYQAPMVREYIRAAYAEKVYGPDWKVPH